MTRSLVDGIEALLDVERTDRDVEGSLLDVRPSLRDVLEPLVDRWGSTSDV